MDLRVVAEALGGELSGCKRVSGLANETFRLDVRADGVVKRFAVKVYLGRDARGKAAKEHRIYSLLPAFGLGAPRVVLEDLEGKLLGKPLLAWEWVEGVKAEELLKKTLATAKLMGAGLARLHEVPPRAAGLELPSGGFWAREAASVELLLRLRGLRLPRSTLGTFEEREITLLHGDYSAGNLLVSRGRLFVIDCESASAGDPLYDVAYCYAFLSASSWRAAEVFAGSYFELSGRDPSGFAEAVRLVALKLYSLLSSDFIKSYMRWKAGPLYPVMELAFLKRLRRHMIRLAGWRDGILGSVE